MFCFGRLLQTRLGFPSLVFHFIRAMIEKKASSVCVCVCKHVHMCMGMSTCAHACVCRCTCVRVHLCVCLPLNLHLDLSPWGKPAALSCEQLWRDPLGEDLMRLPPAARVSLRVHFPAPRRCSPSQCLPGNLRAPESEPPSCTAPGLLTHICQDKKWLPL